MLSPDKRGIVCDRCGMSVLEKFTYFSFDANEVSVINNSMTFLKSATSTYSIDICERCMEEIKAIIIKCYKPYRIVDNRSCPRGIFCDLSGVHLSGTFTCYYICVSSVMVDIQGNPITTVKDGKYLELWVSANAFLQLKNRALEIQNSKENREWSSQTIKTK